MVFWDVMFFPKFPEVEELPTPITLFKSENVTTKLKTPRESEPYEITSR